MITLCTYALYKHNTAEIISLVVNHQFSLIKKDGKWEKVESSKRKQAEEAVIQATKNWEYTFDAVPDPIAILDNKYRVVRVNRAMAARLGVTPEECVGVICYRAIHGTDKPPSNCPHRQLLKDKLEHIKEVREDNLGGDFIVSVSPLFNSEGKLTGCIHVARDINERKQAEEALKKAHESLEQKIQERTTELEEAYKSLKESEERLSEAQRIAKLGNWDWNIVTNGLYWSDEIYRIFERSPQEFGATYDAFLSYVYPDDRDYVNNAIIEALNGKPYSIDLRIILANGLERIVHEQGEVTFDGENIPIRMIGTVQDITERRKSEEKIQSLANIVESSNDAIGTISLDGIITSWNKGAEQVYGYSAEEVLGKTISIVAPSHLAEETQRLSELIQQGERVHQYETLRLRKDGKIIDVSINLSPVFDVYGKLIGISFVVRDVTKRKEAEEKLRESEEKYRNIVETANEGILITDNEAIITYVNQKIVDMLRYTLEKVIGKPIWDFISEEYKPIVKLNLGKRGQGISESYELKLLRKDGSPLWTLLNAKPLFDKEGKYMGAMSMLTDITKRKEAEEALANIETVRQKEIHHRIKNNLQVISSLLDLQADNFNDPKVIEAFRESQSRVISMALIHEELYKEEGTDTLNFSEYLKTLAENLFQTYRLSSKNIHLKMDLEENSLFNMDIAVPLGIIVNELVSNSLKHAFPGRNNGEIRIKLRREGNGEYKVEGCKSTNFILTVSDDGVGIPKNLDIEELDTLGMQLVTSLVDQLDGELELKRDNGTEFTIRFTVKEKSEQASVPAPHLII